MIASDQALGFVDVAGFPRRQRQQFARGVPERTPVAGLRLEPGLQFGVGHGVDQQQTGAHRCEVLQHLADAAVSRDVLIGLYRGLAVGRRELGRLAKARQHAIARRAGRRDLGEGFLGLLVLALVAERNGRLECHARSLGLPGLPVIVAAPRRDPGDDQNAQGDDIISVTVPQLPELVATDFFVDFLENIGHERSPPRPSGAGAAPRTLVPHNLAVWREHGKAQMSQGVSPSAAAHRSLFPSPRMRREGGVRGLSAGLRIAAAPPHPPHFA